MIQLYSPGNRNYDKNGDAVLHPISCLFTANLSGEWILELENPDDENANKIVKEAVIKCDTPMGKEQRFRVYDYEKDEDGVSAKARPVFFDAARDTMILDKRPTEKNGQEALDILVEGTRYTAESDITGRNTAYYERKNLIEAINGDDDNSFVNRWGGEPLYKNEHLIMNRRIGSDYGAHVRFGLNMTHIAEKVNMEKVATRIIPMAYNGYMLEGDKPWVDSPNLNKYEIVYTKIIKYDDVKMKEDAREGEEGCESLAKLREVLKKKVQEEYKNGIDLPEVSYDVDVVALENAEEYKDIKDLVSVGFGDTVYVDSDKLGIKTKSRCIKIVYNCISQRNEKIGLGDEETDYFSNMNSVMQHADQALTQNGVRGEMVYGIIDAIKARLESTAKNAKDLGCKSFLMQDLVSGNGAMAMGPSGFMIAAERTADGKDWNWRTFGTGQGFFADLIVAGTMLADRIRGGELLSQNYEEGKQGFKLDLNNGIIKAAQLLIETAKAGRVERGFRFRNGNLEILGTNGEVTASVHCCWSYPDGPDGIPSGWKNYVAFTAGEAVDNYYGGFWIENENEKRCGAHASGMQFNAEKNLDISAGKEMNVKAKKATINATEEMILKGKRLEETANEKIVNSQNTKTGRAEFADGTYLEFVNGYLVGGNAKAGGF